MVWLLLVVTMACNLRGQVVEIPTSPLEQPEAGPSQDDPGGSVGDEPVPGGVSEPAPVAPPPPLPLPPPLPRQGSLAALGITFGSYSAVPSMIGDTTGGSCGVVRFEGGVPVVSVGHPTFACSRVNISENNSALIRNRIYVSYRRFENTSNLLVFPTSPNGGVADLDIDRFTFGMERTFFESSSIELRIPVNRQMSSSLFFAQTTATTLGGPPNVILPLDDYETSLGNIAVIAKHNLIRRCDCLISGGLGLNLPTAPDVALSGEIDDENFSIEDITGNPITSTNVQFSFDALIKNELITLSPFLAFVASPNEDWFFQGFAQLDIPIKPLFGSFQAGLALPDFGISLPNIGESGDIRLQKLVRFSLGAGRWIYRSPHECSRGGRLRGVAVTTELHYTTTIEDAPLVEVEVLPPIGNVVPGTSVQIGNISNRNDILNILFGTSCLVGRTSFTVAAVSPLRDDDDRGFEYELNASVDRRF